MYETVCILMEVARRVVKVSSTGHLWTKYHTYMEPVGPNLTQSGEQAAKYNAFIDNCISLPVQKYMLYECKEKQSLQ